MFGPMFSDVFGFMPGNEKWKAQRKACGHMFFKQKLQIMAGVFKEHVNIECDKMLADIEKKGEARMDISVVFERIFGHTINHICFGEDYNDIKFMILCYDTEKDTWTEKRVSMRECLHNLTTQVILMFGKKLTHPITGPANLLFGQDWEIGTFCSNVR